MKKIIVVHGMKRSGNHAIIHWLLAHGRFIFINNILPINPVLSGKELIPSQAEFNYQWLRKRLPLHKRFPVSLDFGSKRLLWKPSMMVSLEDHDLKTTPDLIAACRVENILIIRDPQNMFASRIRKASTRTSHPAYPARAGADLDRVIRLWKVHAREFLSTTSHLENKTCIYFDLWFSSREYRMSICQALGFNFTDKGYSKVATEGGGSSFDRTNPESGNQRPDVLNRQSYLQEHEQELLENIFADKELSDLARKIREAYITHQGNYTRTEKTYADI